MYQGGGGLYSRVHGLTQDGAKAVALFQKAVALYRKSCDGGDAKSCGDLSIMYADGDGVPKDLAKVIQLDRRPAMAGTRRNVSTSGIFTFSAPGIIPKDKAKAVALYQKACDDWYWVGCVKVKMYAKWSHWPLLRHATAGR